MDYFENILKKVLEQRGMWVRQSVKVNITKAEKREIGKYSMPRPELDLVGYSPRDNVLEVWEAKSYLDSPGVKFADLNKEYDVPDGLYKMFTCETLRRVTFARLATQWVEVGLILPNPQVKLGLAGGNFYREDEQAIRDLFAQKGWSVMGPQDLRDALEDFEKLDYENDPYVIAAKMIFRNGK